MKDRETIIVRKLNTEQIEQRFIKMGRDFKAYKKDWSLSVTQNENIFTVHALNNKRFISVNYHSTDQSAKSMKISIIEKEGILLLEKDFNYSRSHFVLVKLIPNLTYSIFIVNTLYMIISSIQHIKINRWFEYAELLLVGTSVVWLYINKGSAKLEKDRFRIIEEILQRLIYD
jgi:hypothetical protein